VVNQIVNNINNLGDTLVTYIGKDSIFVENLVENEYFTKTLAHDTTFIKELLFDSVFISELYDDTHIKQLIDSVAALIKNGGDTTLIQEIVNQVTQKTNIIQLGDSLAYYFSQTVLSDTIKNYFKSISNIDTAYVASMIRDSLAKLNITSNDTTINVVRNGSDFDLSVNIKKIADSIAKTISSTILRDTIVNIVKQEKKKSGEAIWLPSFNLTWDADTTNEQTVDLYETYKNTFRPDPSPTSYFSSTGSIVPVPDHTEDVATDFHYVITEFDSNVILLLSLDADGKLTYKTRTPVPPVTSFMNVLLVRK
jgi:hypothetical protein